MPSPFERLHPDVQRWVWGQGWASLRPIQERAIEAMQDRAADTLIAAPTASGKTEAALLPIFTDLATTRPDGLSVLYIAPLRALINDQARRIESMCELTQMRFQPWHGDIHRGRAGFWRKPAQVLLITPESLEAMLMLRSRELSTMLPSLRWIVVDELHAFIGTERGMQLQSLMDRVTALTKTGVPRVGLSATMGDLEIAARFLRPRAAQPCNRLSDDGHGAELRLITKSFVKGDRNEDDAISAESRVANELFDKLRGTSNLVFANRRMDVETFADKLRRRSELECVPNEFFPHHGALSAELRTFVEQRLREGTPPTTAICTSTLELGIDIGDVASVAQVGVPPSAASLKQRVGRSGRRAGTAQVLRQFVILNAIDSNSDPVDRLRLELIQTIATIHLLLAGRFAPPISGELHLSTLIQQLLSTLYETGGVSPWEAYRRLCQQGAFVNIDSALFTALLHALGEREVITQADDGTLLPGATGESVAEHYSFYAAFLSPEEYKIVAEGHALGTLPIDSPLVAGSLLIFAGRRWRVLQVDDRNKTIAVRPDAGGMPPRFGGGGRRTDGDVRRAMLELLDGEAAPAFLDATSLRELAAARAEFRRDKLVEHGAIQHGTDVWIAMWQGDRVIDTVVLALHARGIAITRDGPFLVFEDRTIENARELLAALAADLPTDPLTLVASVENLIEQKHDHWLDRALLERNFAARHLDLPGLHALAQHWKQYGRDTGASA
jgi:ATP-dependent Lhr-like helicase